MDEPKDGYTIMIFRGSVAGPLKFTFSRSLIRKSIGIAAALLVVEIILLSQAVIRIGEMWELKALRAEMANVREQTTLFSNTVDDLKRRLLAMKEVNQRLRLMLGIEPQKSENVYEGKGGDSAAPVPVSGEVPAATNETEGKSASDEAAAVEEPKNELLAQ